jgi:hypothetical protein
VMVMAAAFCDNDAMGGKNLSWISQVYSKKTKNCVFFLGDYGVSRKEGVSMTAGPGTQYIQTK